MADRGPERAGLTREPDAGSGVEGRGAGGAADGGDQGARGGGRVGGGGDRRDHRDPGGARVEHLARVGRVDPADADHRQAGRRADLAHPLQPSRDRFRLGPGGEHGDAQVVGAGGLGRGRLLGALDADAKDQVRTQTHPCLLPGSPCPRCTPAAPQAIASSMRSSTMNSTPRSPHRSASSWASGSSSSSRCTGARSWTAFAPPSMAPAATSAWPRPGTIPAAVTTYTPSTSFGRPALPGLAATPTPLARSGVPLHLIPGTGPRRPQPTGQRGDPALRAALKPTDEQAMAARANELREAGIAWPDQPQPPAPRPPDPTSTGRRTGPADQRPSRRNPNRAASIPCRAGEATRHAWPP